jgi:threonyl-tRNA synthetase
MPNISLPDGSVRVFDKPVTGEAVAADIGRKLARDAVAVRIDGRLRDLATAIDSDAALEIITRDSVDGLEILRHDAAHVMAEAVKELFPETQVTIGPVIEDGFFYDFARDEPFHPDDLARIEARMQAIVDRDERISREVWDRDEAIRFFREQGEHYKV